ncbi:glycosyltransferase family 2 protein [uncultured Desulfosarcina sp.]|uniref:glycosyltransferase family 2 protein n=1 Tax=uncultured Desulfosarcina sp. TaxID=218289 RepID=UPI0029C7C381|nr:glycosyltransferase family 2 protein [uncultured Desulfosarcina sp.]
MDEEKPLVSVAMPVFNGEPYIEEAIRCVLNQTYNNLELVISDNASTDNTEQVCRDFKEKDDRVVYIRNTSNIGAAKNYNQAFRNTTGLYFRWHNADDLCSPRLVEVCLEVLMGNPDTVLCYGKTDIIDDRGELLEHYDDNLDLRQPKPTERFKAFFQQVGLTNIIYGLMRRSTVERTMLMGEGTFFASDVNFMAEMSLYGKFYEIPETHFFRRMHARASSWERKNDTVQRDFWQGQSRKFFLPNWKKNIAYLKAIRNSPISIAEKIRLFRFVARRIIMCRRDLLRDLLLEWNWLSAVSI